MSKKIDQKWNRWQQIAVILTPIVMLLIFVATPLMESLIPQQGSQGDSPTGVQVDDPREQEPPVVSATPPKPPEAESESTTPVPPVFQTQTRERTVERNFVNGHCESSTNIKWEVRAVEGWQIDVTSLDIKPQHVSSKSSYFGVSDLTTDGFTINGRVSNNGDCVRVLGKVIARDGRGHLMVGGTYDEVREVQVN